MGGETGTGLENKINKVVIKEFGKKTTISPSRVIAYDQISKKYIKFYITERQFLPLVSGMVDASLKRAREAAERGEHYSLTIKYNSGL